MKKGYLFKLWKTLKQAILSADRRVFLASFYDLLFYLGFAASLWLWAYAVKKKSALVNLDLASIDMTNQAMLNITLESMRSFLVFVVFSIVAFLIIVVLVYSIFKGLVWLTIMKKSPSWRFFKQFALVNLIWFFGWGFFFTAAAMLLRPGAGVVALLLLLILMIHLSALIVVQLVLTADVRKALRQSFALGFKRSHLFLLPYLAILVGYVILSQLGWLFKLLPRGFELALTVVITLLYFGLARIYFVNVVRELK